MEDFRNNGEKPTPVKIMNRLRPILSAREIRSTIATIENTGSQVFYVSADINNSDELKKKTAGITKKAGPVTGIIHGAGVLADKLIEEKTEKDFKDVYSTKINGLKGLLGCAEPDNLDYLILFSSSAGFYGNEGQSDYAVANEILNKFAHGYKCRFPSCHVIVFNWGPWDGGMVTPEIRKLFEQRNIDVIPKEVGTKMMVDELNQANQEIVQVVIGSSMVVTGSPGTQLKSYRIRRKVSLADNTFLKDHAIGGEPVLPIICAVSWMAQTCEQLHPGYRFFSCENTRVLKGIVFNESQSDGYLLEIDEIENQESDEVSFNVKVSSHNQTNKPIFHYSSKISLKQAIHVKPVYTDYDLETSKPVNAELFYANGTLFHGPIFQIIRQMVNFSPEKMTVECEVNNIDEKIQGQFTIDSFNPFADDAMLQAMLIWARQMYQAGSLPLSIGNGEFYTPIGFDEKFYVTLEVKSSSKSKLTADLIAHSKMGEVYSRLRDAEITISESLNEKFSYSRPRDDLLKSANFFGQLIF